MDEELADFVVLALTAFFKGTLGGGVGGTACKGSSGATLLLPTLSLVSPKSLLLAVRVSSLADATNLGILGIFKAASAVAIAAPKALGAATFAEAVALDGNFFTGVVSKGSARRRPRLTAVALEAVEADLGTIEAEPSLDRVPTVTVPGGGFGGK